MADRSTSVCGTGAWSELLQAAHGALATLDADELEELSRRVEILAAGVTNVSEIRGEARESLGQLKMAVPDHRRLGNLLLATNGNLQVLRRLWDSERVEPPWER